MRHFAITSCAIALQSTISREVTQSAAIEAPLISDFSCVFMFFHTVAMYIAHVNKSRRVVARSS